MRFLLRQNLYLKLAGLYIIREFFNTVSAAGQSGDQLFGKKTCQDRLHIVCCKQITPFFEKSLCHRPVKVGKKVKLQCHRETAVLEDQGFS